MLNGPVCIFIREIPKLYVEIYIVISD